MTDKIAKFFDMQPIMETKPVELIGESNSQVDEVKSNIQDLIDVSKVATAEMYSIATSSQQSRDYDTLAKLIKTTADINKDLLEIEYKQREMKTKESPEGSKIVHNTIVFQGTTEEILRQLEEAKK